jgi:hypothetical protein
MSQHNGTFTWSHNGEKVQLKYTGEIEFTDDDKDVKRLSPGGYLRISDGGWFGGRAVEFRADQGGAIQRRFWKGSSEYPFDPEGRQWLAGVLPRFIRQSGIGAEARVARILNAKGPDGVLAEIALIEGSYGKRRYFTELLKAATLDAAASRRVLEQAGREIDSDYELATLLIDAADKLLVDDATRKAYFEAARTIGSDYEMRRAYGAALRKGSVSPALLAGILDASRDIESDYEAASLLIDVAKRHPLDGAARAPFFGAVSGIGSDYEKGRVLTAVVSRGGLSDDLLISTLEGVATISSDYEAASVLQRIARGGPLDGAARAAFMAAVDTIASNHERGRALEALAAHEPRKTSR